MQKIVFRNNFEEITNRSLFLLKHAIILFAPPHRNFDLVTNFSLKYIISIYILFHSFNNMYIYTCRRVQCMDAWKYEIYFECCTGYLTK